MPCAVVVGFVQFLKRDTEMKKRLIFGVVAVAVLAVVVMFGRWLHHEYVCWSFGNYVTGYSHRVERDTAYAVFELTKGNLSDSYYYEKRLKKLDDDFNHPYRTAIHNLSDPEFPRKGADYFNKIIDGIRQEVRQDATFSAEVKEKVEKLCRLQREVEGIAWPFVCEHLNLHCEDGVEGASIPYHKVVSYKQKLQTLEAEVTAMLAAN